MAKKLVVPKLIKIAEFEATRPELKERGVAAFFPTLFEHNRAAKQEWLEEVLMEGYNGSRKSTAEYVTFCTSGDAVIIMKSAELADALVKRSPLYQVGTVVTFHKWDQVLKTKLQYRGAYNQIMELVEEDI